MTNRNRGRVEYFEDPDQENESFYGFQRMDFTDVENFSGIGVKFDKNEMLAEKMLHKDFYNDFGDLFADVTHEYRPPQTQTTKQKEKEK